MEWLKKIIDDALAEMSKDTISMMVPGEIPDEMLDTSILSSDDWKGWKPMNSIISDADIDLLEREIRVPLPKSYREYLKYKHFFHLRLPDIAINLPNHLPDKSLTNLRGMMLRSYDPELTFGRKYIYFADFHDYGLLCFDANQQVADNEYPVVWLDHENGKEVFFYSSNFRDLLESHAERGNDFIEKLNDRFQAKPGCFQLLNPRNLIKVIFQ